MRKLILHRLIITIILGLSLSSLHSNEGSMTSVCYGKPNFSNGKVKRVVIDAGHGGKDPGCIGTKSKEKDIALKLALLTGEKIKKLHPDVEVLYTRKKDVFVPLYKRIKFANSHQADLFISVHCNFVDNRTVYGTETFVMGLHTVEENLDVAKRENQVILLEKDFEDNYDGYDPNSPMGHIILSNYQNAYLDQSLHIAKNVEDQLSGAGNRKSRGVKQAGFVVLKRATMPSILVEAGFLSHPREQKYLISKEGQEEVATSIAYAFSNYKLEQESQQIAKTKKTITPQPEVKDIVSIQPVKPSEEKANKKPSKTIIRKQPTAVKKAYQIQIAATKSKPINNAEVFQGIEDLQVIYVDGLYKYHTGNFQSLTEAAEAKKDLRARGFKGAFIVSAPHKKTINGL